MKSKYMKIGILLALSIMVTTIVYAAPVNLGLLITAKDKDGINKNDYVWEITEITTYNDGVYTSSDVEIVDSMIYWFLDSNGATIGSGSVDIKHWVATDKDTIKILLYHDGIPIPPAETEFSFVKVAGTLIDGSDFEAQGYGFAWRRSP